MSLGDEILLGLGWGEDSMYMFSGHLWFSLFPVDLPPDAIYWCVFLYMSM